MSQAKKILKKKERSMAQIISKIPIILVCTVLFHGCGNDSEQSKIIKPDDYTGIILSKNTSLRVDPYIFSAKISMLNKGETVKVVERSKTKSWIGKSHNYWYKVIRRDTIPGWVYGEHIKLVKSSSQSSVNNYIADYWDKEAEKLKKEISGKWWSVTVSGEFTDHCLEIESNGKYRSYKKGQRDNAVNGDYNFDFNRNEIVFLQGTSFNKNLNFIKRGNTYFFKTPGTKEYIKFKKIINK